MNRPVVIVGGGASSAAVDWRTPAEIWGLAALGNMMQRCDRWFELHPLSTLLPREIQLCERSTVPVYMRQRHKSIPQSVRFPLEHVLLLGRHFFTNSYCYQIALAIAEERPEITLYGMGDFRYGSARERVFELPGVAYWIGVATGKEIEIKAPAQDELVTAPYLYGLEYWDEVAYVRVQLRALQKVLNAGAFDGFQCEEEVNPQAAQIAEKL